MNRTTAAALLLAAGLTLTACTSDPDDKPPATPTSAPPAASAPAEEDPAPSGDEAALTDAVTKYTAAYFKGDEKTAHALLSGRCAEEMPVEILAGVVDQAAKDYGQQKVTSVEVDQVAGDMARVSYEVSIPKFSQKSQPWVREDGTWKYDAC